MEDHMLRDCMIVAFDEGYLLDHPNPHNDALMISIMVSNIEVHYILVDIKSSVEI